MGAGSAHVAGPDEHPSGDRYQEAVPEEATPQPRVGAKEPGREDLLATNDAKDDGPQQDCHEVERKERAAGDNVGAQDAAGRSDSGQTAADATLEAYGKVQGSTVTSAVPNDRLPSAAPPASNEERRLLLGVPEASRVQRSEVPGRRKRYGGGSTGFRELVDPPRATSRAGAGRVNSWTKVLAVLTTAAFALDRSAVDAVDGAHQASAH